MASCKVLRVVFSMHLSASSYLRLPHYTRVLYAWRRMFNLSNSAARAITCRETRLCVLQKIYMQWCCGLSRDIPFPLDMLHSGIPYTLLFIISSSLAWGTTGHQAVGWASPSFIFGPLYTATCTQWHKQLCRWSGEYYISVKKLLVSWNIWYTVPKQKRSRHRAIYTSWWKIQPFARVCCHGKCVSCMFASFGWA